MDSLQIPNILSLLSFFAFIVHLYLGITALKLEPKSEQNRTFFCLCLCFAIWSFGYIFFNITTVKENLWLWYRLSSIGWTTFPGFVLHFFLALTKKEKILKKIWIYPVLYLPGAIFLYRSFTGILVDREHIYIKGLGWVEVVATDSPWFWIFSIYYSGYVIVGLLLCLIWGKKTRILREKKQARIILFAGLCALIILGSLPETILPSFNIHLPPLSHIAILVWQFMIWYAIVKYKLMVLTPAVAVDDILKTAADSIILISPEEKIMYVNQATLDLLGYEANELIGKPVEIIFGKPLFEEIKIENLLKEKIIKDYRLTYRTKSGDSIPVNFLCSVMKDKDGEFIGVVSVVHDMRKILELQEEEKKLSALAAAERARTEALQERAKELEEALMKTKQMQEQLIRSEKLAVIGQLSSAIGHELRNPLTSLKNIAYCFQKVHHFEDQKVSQLVQLLSIEVDRANKIISDLLDFARIKKHNKVLVDIEKLVNNILENIPLPKNINIVKDIVNLQVNIDPDKFAHILTNLVTNARDAISGEGEIQVSVKKSGEYVEVVVSDNGCGMDEETVKHIFDPLFTTKVKGLGLGLAIVKDIVDADNGKIEVKSEKGKGTTFKIILSS